MLPIESSYVIRYDFIYYGLLKFQMLQGIHLFHVSNERTKIFPPCSVRGKIGEEINNK